MSCHILHRSLSIAVAVAVERECVVDQLSILLNSLIFMSNLFHRNRTIKQRWFLDRLTQIDIQLTYITSISRACLPPLFFLFSRELRSSSKSVLSPILLPLTLTTAASSPKRFRIILRIMYHVAYHALLIAVERVVNMSKHVQILSATWTWITNLLR